MPALRALPMRWDDAVGRTGTRDEAVPRIALTIGCLLIVWIATAVGALDLAASGDENLQATQVEIGREALRISVPPTWRKLMEGPAVIFAPADGQTRVAGKSRV